MGDFTAVERLAFALGNRPQAFGSRLELEQLTYFRRSAPRQKCGGKAWQTLKLIGRSCPLFLHHRGHQVAALGHVDGGL